MNRTHYVRCVIERVITGKSLVSQDCINYIEEKCGGSINHWIQCVMF